MLNIDDRLIKEVSPKIRPNALSVLLAIAIHLNQKSGRCFPSHERIMQLTGMGKNAVYDALAVLKESGLLVSEQAINSKNKKFGRRTFRLTTKFIKIFVDASDMEPLPESREPESREPESRETYQLNEVEQINNFEQINEGEGNATLSPPFRKVDEIDIPLEAEKKEKDFTGAGPTPQTELLVTTHTPQAPYMRVVERVEVPVAPGPKSPGDTTKPGRRSNTNPTIHPENVGAFDHFSDPEKCRMLWSEWIEYKWGQHRDKYKTPQSELVMLRKLYTWSHGQSEIVSQIIEKSVGNLYKGLIDPNEKKGNGTEKRHDLNPAQRQHLALAKYVAQRRIDAENRDAMG